MTINVTFSFWLNDYLKESLDHLESFALFWENYCWKITFLRYFWVYIGKSSQKWYHSPNPPLISPFLHAEGTEHLGKSKDSGECKFNLETLVSESLTQLTFYFQGSDDRRNQLNLKEEIAFFTWLFKRYCTIFALYKRK